MIGKIETKELGFDLILNIGKGHILFKTNWQPRRDILTGENKPSVFNFDSDIAANVYNDISIVYGINISFTSPKTRR